LVKQNQFGGSTIENVGMHLNTSSEICNILGIKDVNLNAVKLAFLHFHLQGRLCNGYYLFLLELLFLGETVAICSSFSLFSLCRLQVQRLKRFTVKVFDETMCRRHYLTGEDD
jgi:hypothetical protein